MRIFKKGRKVEKKDGWSCGLLHHVEGVRPCRTRGRWHREVCLRLRIRVEVRYSAEFGDGCLW